MPRARALAVPLLFAAVLGAGPLQAQQGQPVFTPVVSSYDFDALADTFCLLSQQKRDEGNRLKNAGLLTTAVAASGTPLSLLGVGDELTVQRDAGAAGTDVRAITADDGTTLTLNAAANWSGNGASGFAFTYRTHVCSTTTAGWFGVPLGPKHLVLQVDQINAGQVDVIVQCRGYSPWAQPVLVYPPGGATECLAGGFTAVAACQIPLEGPWKECRVGVSVTADDGDDTGANREAVTVYLEGAR